MRCDGRHEVKPCVLATLHALSSSNGRARLSPCNLSSPMRIYDFDIYVHFETTPVEELYVRVHVITVHMDVLFEGCRQATVFHNGFGQHVTTSVMPS